MFVSTEEPREQQALPRLGYLLKRAHLQFVEIVGTALAPLGIDSREWGILISLDDHQPRSQVDIAQLMGIDRTTMVALVDELQEKGLVQRRPHSDDRRKNVVEITPAGRELRRRAARKVDDTERRYLAKLSEADARLLKSSLNSVIDQKP